MDERDESFWGSERLSRAIFDRALDAMILLDPDGRCVEANPAACALFGLERALLLGRSVFESVAEPPDARREWEVFLERASLRGGCVMRRPDGALRSLEYAATAHILPGVHLALLRDVTEERSLEAQLRQAQKMEAVGRLAGGVAHDFNNLMSVILSQVEVLREPLAPGDPMRDDLAQVIRAAERAAELTRQLLAFSRQQVLQPQPIDLMELLRALEPRLKRRLGAGITLRLSSAEGVERALVDPSQIERVVMDLADNARDAMPTGGALSIAVASVTLDGPAGREHGLAEGDYVTLAVTDTGVGMDEAARARVFEPFFTTRPLGEGAGLGLSTVFGIVTQSGGHVAVDSAPGRGATFTIYLPRTLRAPEQSAPVAPVQGLPRGTETVLLVEDEEPLRNLARRILQRGGYTVLAARNGGEAFLISEQHAGRVHLLLTDVMMPGVGGIQLAERLLRVRPDLKVLLMSGYASAAPQGTPGAAMGFMPKPFTPEVLLRRVREILDAPAGGGEAG